MTFSGDVSEPKAAAQPDPSADAAIPAQDFTSDEASGTPAAPSEVSINPITPTAPTEPAASSPAAINAVAPESAAPPAVEPAAAAFSAPTQVPAAAAPPEPTYEPQLAAIVEIPAQDTGESSDGTEGGEWELLVNQVRDWLNSLKLQETFQELRRPLTLLGWLVGLIVVLRVYAAVIGTLDHLPLVPGLLELVGVIALVRFAATNLVRSQERQALLQQLRDRWTAFRG